GPGEGPCTTIAGGTRSGRFTARMVEVGLCPAADADRRTEVEPKPTRNVNWNWPCLSAFTVCSIFPVAPMSSLTFARAYVWPATVSDPLASGPEITEAVIAGFGVFLCLRAWSG